MIERMRQAIDHLISGDQPMYVKDGDVTHTLTRKDVHEIMRKCDCSEEEARDRLAGWIVDRLEGKSE